MNGISIQFLVQQSLGSPQRLVSLIESVFDQGDQVLLAQAGTPSLKIFITKGLSEGGPFSKAADENLTVLIKTSLSKPTSQTISLIVFHFCHDLLETFHRRLEVFDDIVGQEVRVGQVFEVGKTSILDPGLSRVASGSSGYSTHRSGRRFPDSIRESNISLFRLNWFPGQTVQPLHPFKKNFIITGRPWREGIAHFLLLFYQRGLGFSPFEIADTKNRAIGQFQCLPQGGK
jgi:hypothetical protein